MTEPLRLRLGTRTSRLATIQARLVADALEARGNQVELVPIVTAGDRRARDETWTDDAFVGELRRALRAGEIDLAVHSAKDVPLPEPDEPQDLVIAAFPERADPRDALVMRASEAPSDPDAAHGGAPFPELPRAARVGTDSPRRDAFLRAQRPDLNIQRLSGNVDTRLGRLDAGEVDALVLAVAGLVRLGVESRISRRLDVAIVPPAPGQGALAVEVRAADEPVRVSVAALDVADVRLAVEAERAVLAGFGGGCRAPVGALATVDADHASVSAAAVRPGGSPVTRQIDGTPRDIVERARRAGEQLAVEVGRR